MLRLIVDEEGAQRLTRKHPWLFRRHFSVKTTAGRATWILGGSGG
jgi:hypothetical protein